MVLFLVLAAIPIVEIALFILIGGWIGLLPTLGLVMLAVLAGITLFRTQAARTALSLQQAMAGLRDPSGVIAESAAVMMAAVLFIMPGFLSDAVAVCLLIPPLRSLILRSVMGRVAVRAARSGSAQASRPGAGPDVIEGDYLDVTPDGVGGGPQDGPRSTAAMQRPSGWTQH